MLVAPQQCVPCHLVYLVSPRPPDNTGTRGMWFPVVESTDMPSALDFQVYFFYSLPKAGLVSLFLLYLMRTVAYSKPLRASQEYSSIITLVFGRLIKLCGTGECTFPFQLHIPPLMIQVLFPNIIF